MPVFMCRWQNGDVSFAAATRKSDAIELLDEVGGASEDMLTEVENFMAHFRLDDVGDVKLEGFGESTQSDLEQKAYPVLDKVRTALPDPGETQWTEEHKKKLAAAVYEERTRLWPNDSSSGSDLPKMA
ncbi:MAG: hypothetical protein WAL95_03070 [Candidatus Acidiferrales bacterium]